MYMPRVWAKYYLYIYEGKLFLKKIQGNSSSMWVIKTQLKVSVHE